MLLALAALVVIGAACGFEGSGQSETESQLPGPATPAAGWASAGKAPLVILVSIDTLRADALGLYGYERFTSPTLDMLAAEGAVFDDASTTAPWTLPAHASMLTGLYPASAGVLTSRHVMPAQVPTLAGRLNEAGFITAAVVNSIWLKKDNYEVTRDFEKYLWIEEDVRRASPSTWVSDQALIWLRERPQDRPMFLFLHYYDVHADYRSLPAYERLFVEPYDGDVEGTALEIIQANVDPVWEAYCRDNFSEARCTGQSVHEGLVLDESFERRHFSEADLRHLRNLYDAGVRQIDAELGRLFGSLRESGDLDDALVFVLSDHGEEFGEHGRTDHMRTQYQEVVRIPFLIRGPGVPAGARFDTPVSLVDIAPTVLSYAGIEPSLPLDGRDLSPLWRGGDTSMLRSRLIFQDAGYGSATSHHLDELLPVAPRTMAVRRDRFKLYYDKRADPAYVLYDLDTDPAETRDVSAAHREVTAELRAILKERIAAVDGGVAGPEVELSPEDEARLRALGYLN
jgi:arylsulfatase A-like enzyme